MQRIWFKKEMMQKLIEDKKFATTRYKRLREQQEYLCVYGSRFKAVSFGRIKINSCLPLTWRQVIRGDFNMEGFKSPAEMQDYLVKEKLVRNTLNDQVWFHEFEFYRDIPSRLTSSS